MRASLIAGLTEEAFWAATPVETGRAREAAAEREKRAYRLALWASWHGEAFARSKRLPAADKVFAKFDGRRRLSPDEMLRKVELLNAAWGGDDLRKKDGMNG